MTHGPPLRIETLTGAALVPLLPALARLRIAVFRDWPYLYDGDDTFEARYLRRYADCPLGAVVVAWDGDTPVGASTCLPLEVEPDTMTLPFRARTIPPERVAYFGESVLLPGYRGRGAGVAFFAQRELHARRIGRRLAAFCAVVRDPADPRRPKDAQDLVPFWTRRGFVPRPDMTCRMDWREIGRAQETTQTLAFWTKAL